MRSVCGRVGIGGAMRSVCGRVGMGGSLFSIVGSVLSEAGLCLSSSSGTSNSPASVCNSDS